MAFIDDLIARLQKDKSKAQADIAGLASRIDQLKQDRDEIIAERTKLQGTITGIDAAIVKLQV